jgi:hypothetical protein
MVGVFIEFTAKRREEGFSFLVYCHLGVADMIAVRRFIVLDVRRFDDRKVFVKASWSRRGLIRRVS